MANINDEERQRTLWCGNLHPKVTEEMLYELFLQAGPLEKVKLVQNKGYAFITFKHALSVPYTIQLMNGIQLYHTPMQLQTRTGSSSVFGGKPITPSPVTFPPGFNPMLSSNASNGSKFMHAQPPSPAVALNPGTRETTGQPYHRSMSHPNFTNSQISDIDLRFKVGDNGRDASDKSCHWSQPNSANSQIADTDLRFKMGKIGRDAPNKSQSAVRHANQRPNLPYTRSTGYDYDQRCDRNVRNNMVDQFQQQQMMNVAAAALRCANQQLAHRRRY